MIEIYYIISIICFCFWVILSITDYFILKKNGKIKILESHIIESYLIGGIMLAIFWPVIIVLVVISPIRGDHKKKRSDLTSTYKCPCYRR